jgi:hypothetical protein
MGVGEPITTRVPDSFAAEECDEEQSSQTETETR